MLEKWEALYKELPGEISFYEEKIGTGTFINNVFISRRWHQNFIGIFLQFG